MRLKIGEFSRVSRIPVKTLRYYDDLGLLKPVEVDRFTDYRYYSFDQLPRANRILAFKDLGLSLAQIARLLEDDLSAEEMQRMLHLRRAQLTTELEAMQEQLKRVETRLNQLKEEGIMPDYEIVLKTVDPIIAAVRRITITEDAPTAVTAAFGEIDQFIADRGLNAAGPGLTIWHTPAYTHSDEEATVAIPLDRQIEGGARVQVQQLPQASVASVVHTGPWDRFNEAYQAVLKWIDGHGYQIDGPFREIYHAYHDDDSAMSTAEIQFPIKKG